MYEAVHVDPDGEGGLSATVETAARLGFEGVVLRNHGDAPPEADVSSVREQSAIDVADGVEIVADDPSQAGGYLGSYRPERTVVLVHGGDPALNRFAVENERVDVLAHPLAGNGNVNHVVTERAAANDVAIEVDLSPVLRSRDGERVRAVSKLRRLRTLIEHADAPFVVSADPRSPRHLRAPRELQAVGESIGLDAEMIDTGIRTWGRIVERNRRRRSDTQVAPGVRLDSPPADEEGHR